MVVVKIFFFLVFFFFFFFLFFAQNYKIIIIFRSIIHNINSRSRSSSVSGVVLVVVWVVRSTLHLFQSRR